MARRQMIRRTVLLIILLLFPITLNYYSPYLIMQAASEGVANASFFLWSAWTLTALLFGRLACAWFCPLGAAQMAQDAVAPRPLKRFRYLAILKYVLATAWVAGIVAAAVSAGGYGRADLLYMTESGVSADSLRGLMMYYFVLMVAWLPALILGKRAFCHYLCPFGVLNMVASKLGQWLRLPQLHLRAQPERCVACHRCERACPMSLPVTAMVQRGDLRHRECILCGTCIDTCPKDSLRYGFGRQVKG